MAFAGIDVGTSGCKVLVYDLEGNIVFKASSQYKEQSKNGYRELDPEAVMVAVESALQEVGEQCVEKIEALAVTTLGESVVCLDEENRCLFPSMVTGDKRGIAETEYLIEMFGAQEILNITGLPPSEMFELPKLMWLNENTDVIQKADKILFYEDFVGYVLTGKRMVSYSSAARSMAFDVGKKAWSQKLLNAAGIRMEQMSTPVESGQIVGPVLPEVAGRLHLNPEFIVVAGGHDQICAALGSGLSDTKVGECGLGTCEFTFMMLPRPVKSAAMIDSDLTCIPYVFPNTYLTSMEVTTCGVMKNWGRDTIFSDIAARCRCADEDFYAYMDELIKDLKTDVMLLPQFGSSGNPDINYAVKGTVTGLTTNTKLEEIYLAMLEGMTFQSYLAYERAKILDLEMEKIVLTGGGAKSEVMLQLRADVFNMITATITTTESGTLGCMLLAATAMGKYRNLKDGIAQAIRIKKEYVPNPEKHAYYMHKYEKYKKLYALMHNF